MPRIAGVDSYLRGWAHLYQLEAFYASTNPWINQYRHTRTGDKNGFFIAGGVVGQGFSHYVYPWPEWLCPWKEDLPALVSSLRLEALREAIDDYEYMKMLSPKEFLFVKLMAGGEFNTAAEAYIAAGYKTTNANSAAAAASRLLNSRGIKEAIGLLQKTRIQAAALDHFEVINDMRLLYRKALNEGKYDAAHKALKSLGEFMNMWGDGRTTMMKIRNQGGYDRADLIMQFLLNKRHLAPTHTSTLYIPDVKQDPLVIEKLPDIFITGHIHKSTIKNYRNITLVCGSCWQAKTPFQEKVGHNPEPARVPVLNLQTRNFKLLKFGK